jgi:hypothetical protein
MGKRKRDRDDPIAEYIDWTENRYNPGYWLGGRVPPHIKQSLFTWKDRRWVGTVLLLPFVVAAVLSWRRGWPYDFDESLVMILMGIPCLILSLLLLLAPSSKTKPQPPQS